MEISRFSCSLRAMLGFLYRKNCIVFSRLVFYRRTGYHCEEKNRWLNLGSDEIKAVIRGEAEFESFSKETEENMGIISLVGSQGRMRHLPMIDFDCPLADHNLLKVIETLSALEQKAGFILNSGQSYHYYGIGLLDAEEWIEFMKKCKTQEFIGKIWPAHQIRKGYSTLRISISDRKPHLPRVIAKIGDFVFKV